MREVSSSSSAAQIARYFSNDAQVSKHFGSDDSSSAVAFEYVSTTLPHADYARSLLLDPDYCAQNSSASSDNSQLRCVTLLLSRAEVLDEAHKIKTDTLLAHKLRHAAQPTHRIALHKRDEDDEETSDNLTSSSSDDCSDEEKSNVMISLSNYSVPVGYRIVGLAAGDTDDKSSSDNEKSSGSEAFVVRVVLETHHLASVQGVIRLRDGAMDQYDSVLTAAIRTYENKTSERAGDPLPVATALAAIVLRKRGKALDTVIVDDDIKRLLSSDQVLVNIECIDTNAREMTKEEQMMSILEQTLRDMGIGTSNNNDASMPALVKDH